jgi:hypothetical protein
MTVVSALTLALNFNVGFGEMVRRADSIGEMIEGGLAEVVGELDDFRTIRALVPAAPLELPMLAAARA